MRSNRLLSPPVLSGYDVTRILLGVVLLAAAVLKAQELEAGPRALGGDRPVRWLLVGIVGFEFIYGLWLLMGLHPKSTWRLTLGVFATLAFVALYKAVSGESSCGCFGKAKLSPWYAVVFDVAAVSALLRFRPSGTRCPTVRSSPMRAAVLVAVVLWMGVPWFSQMGSFRSASLDDSDGAVVTLEPEAWTGSCFPLLKHIDIGDELAEGYWAVVLYHHDCSACQRMIPKYERLARDWAGRSDAPRIALIEMPPYGGAGDNITSRGSQCVLGRLDDVKKWLITTPVEIRISDCIVLPINVSTGHH